MVCKEYLFGIFADQLLSGEGVLDVTLAGGENDALEEEEQLPIMPGVVPGGGRGRGGVRGGRGGGRGGGALGASLGREDAGEVGSGDESVLGGEDMGGMAGMMHMMMRMNKESMRTMVEPMVEVFKTHMRAKRRREEDEEEELKSKPILIDIPNHQVGVQYKN